VYALAVRKIPIEEALGLEIAHDITQIDPEKGIKGARFRKGHIVTEEDISVLKSMGKRHLYIIELTEKEIHEDEAALLMSQKLRGNNVEAAGPEEGKISLKASCDGLVVYDEEMVHSVNSCEDMLLSCLPPYSRVTKGKDVASFRIIPLIMGRSQFNAVTSSMSHIQVRPFHPLRTALISTGSEVKEGLIRDQSLEKISPRVEALGGEVYIYRISGDGAAKVAAEIKDVLLEGAELVICTGGMSVDADDTTREGIESLASRVLFRRAPTLPGCNLELALVGSVPVIGVPAGVLYFDWTTLDLILPMVFAGVYPDREMVSRWGTRGLGCRVLPREV
jgi:hypothetical protein